MKKLNSTALPALFAAAVILHPGLTETATAPLLSGLAVPTFAISETKPANVDWEAVSREGHPVLYGSVSASHDFWDDIERGRIHFPDRFYFPSEQPALALSAYRDSDTIRGIIISFQNFSEPMEVSLDEALALAASYMPFDAIDNYYEFAKSELISPNENAGAAADDSSYYVISYSLTEEGRKAAYKGEHDFSGSIDVVVEVSTDGVVNSLDIGSGLPHWMSSLEINSMHAEEWSFDFSAYRQGEVAS